MSSYKDFVQDFPKRCLKLLRRYYRDAEHNDLEVSLLLNIASSGFIVPFERLKMDSHPSGDSANFISVKEQLEEVGKSCFLSSPLHPDSNPGSWRFSKSQYCHGRDPSAWGLHNLKPLSKEKTVKPLLDTLRNALAHGNIFTEGWPYIERLVFLSRPYLPKFENGKKEDTEDEKYHCLEVSPSDFKSFVEKWLEFISEIGIPSERLA